jgi:hypothetical protein
METVSIALLCTQTGVGTILVSCHTASFAAKQHEEYVDSQPDLAADLAAVPYISHHQKSVPI